MYRKKILRYGSNLYFATGKMSGFINEITVIKLLHVANKDIHCVNLNRNPRIKKYKYCKCNNAERTHSSNVITHSSPLDWWDFYDLERVSGDRQRTSNPQMQCNNIVNAITVTCSFDYRVNWLQYITVLWETKCQGLPINNL